MQNLAMHAISLDVKFRIYTTIPTIMRSTWKAESTFFTKPRSVVVSEMEGNGIWYSPWTVDHSVIKQFLALEPGGKTLYGAWGVARYSIKAEQLSTWSRNPTLAPLALPQILAGIGFLR